MSTSTATLSATWKRLPPPERLAYHRRLRRALFRARPDQVLVTAGLTPDPWQAAAVGSAAPQLLMLCCRQAGKSTAAAALALRQALLTPGSLTLLLSPTLRQSGELFRDKFLELYERTGRVVPPRRLTALELELTNGSRVVSLPENEAGVRGFSGVGLLVIDEASRVDDALYFAVRPMLAVSRGRLVLLSTPFGRRGFFFDAWEGRDGGPWDRYRVTARECPRIAPEFLASERVALGERWFNQEYLCTFEEAVDAVFSAADVHAAVRSDVEALP
jgi:hypothetical protein